VTTAKLRDVAIAVAALIAAAGVFIGHVYDGRPPDSASVDAAALGREFGPMLAVALADGFEAGAATLESPGGSVAAGIEKQKEVAESAKDRAFERKVGPAFALIVPDGDEPKEQSKRSELARVWRDFARGLRKAK
jgi:hypothetical protein